MQQQPLKMAFVQHPMVLLIHEDRADPPVGERVEPWGAPDLPTYAERLRRNLQALRDYPDLLLNYEFSGVEMEMLAEVAPDTITTMREMAAAGRLAFVGGDYSQPHGHLYSGELNYRQLEMGLQVFAEMVNYQITCCFHQETCVHDQLPQLLRAFGFRSVVPPAFNHSLVSLTPGAPCLVTDNMMRGHYAMLARDTVANWRGLDGTEIPLVIPGNFFLPNEYHKGLYRVGGLCVDPPDLDEVTAERYAAIRAIGEFVKLDAEALAEIARYPARWHARFFTYWSYAEGEWAEAVTRKIREAESQLLAEETATTLYSLPPRADRDTDWRTVLAAMHHDVHWTEVTDLKHQYLHRLDAVIARSQRALSPAAHAPAENLTVVNTLPFTRSEVVIRRNIGDTPIRVIRADGTPVPSQCIPSIDGQLDLYFQDTLPACGHGVYTLEADGALVSAPDEVSEVAFQAGNARYTVREDGSVYAAVTADGVNLLNGPGHDLHYLTPDGQPVGGPGRAGRLRRYHGEMGELIRIEAPIGDIPTTVEYLASPHMPWLEIRTRFHFDHHLLGVMWEDWTKLNSYWSVNGHRIRHDIPFGVIDGDAELPLHAPNWVSITDDHQYGLALLNTGTPKHYLEAGTLANVLAWGGEQFSNRMHNTWTANPPGILALDGMHQLRHAVLALEGGCSEVAITRCTQCVNTPLLCVSTALPTPRWQFDLSTTSLISTALILRNHRLTCRFYEAAGCVQTLENLRQAVKAEIEVTDLTGAPLASIEPYRIGYLTWPE